MTSANEQRRLNAEAGFWVRVAELGATPTAVAVYVGNKTPVRLICCAGHACSPTPNNVQKGQGICLTCSNRDPVSAESAFLASVAELGATLAPGASYRGAVTPVALICKDGHACSPRPNDVREGHGICQQCVVTYDRTYLLQHVLGAIKIGVASGDARVRRHLQSGYRLVGQWQGLGHEQALLTEQQCIGFWRSRGWSQVDAAPKDGRTETTSSEHLPETLAWLNALTTTRPRAPTH